MSLVTITVAININVVFVNKLTNNVPVYSVNKPPTGGPTVNGIEHIPSKNPMAWVAPLLPQISNAIGPNNDMKHPSNNPNKSAITTKAE